MSRRRLESVALVLCCLQTTKSQSSVETLLTLDNSLRRTLDRASDDDRWKIKPWRAREVRDGHWVAAQLSPLPHPRTLACSKAVFDLLGLDQAACESEGWAERWAGSLFEEPWATPYALSIYGSVVVPDGAGASGDGYGDGRAISVGDFVGPFGRFEVQLKGAGPTPFRRGGDGRAVLRSSLREFVASEAMAALGVATTRALTLVVSESEVVMRPWYKEQSPFERNVNKHGGDYLKEEPAAITTRLSRSFVRVGSFELYARRAVAGDPTGLRQLRQLAVYAIQRDYAEEVDSAASFEEQVMQLATAARLRHAKLAADWLRVGYAQSNFNSDNCLVSGATLDYGPFGFMEKFSSLWGMWVYAGDHYGFLNQPIAAQRNYERFAASLEPLVSHASLEKLQEIAAGFGDVAEDQVARVFAKKMGLASGPGSRSLWADLIPIMEAAQMDWTIFWRELAYSAASPTSASALLEAASYNAASSAELDEWLRRWRAHAPDSKVMLATSPKYVPREWMLVDAYNAAGDGDLAPLHELMDLLSEPYEEQPQFHARYYRRAPDGSEAQGGVGFMS